MAYLVLTLVLIIAALACWLLYFFYKKIRERLIFYSLEMDLFLVSLTRAIKKEGSDFKSEINLTEQLLASLSSLGKPFTFEMAVHHVGEEIHFYLSVHKSVSDAAVKQIQGIWHDASVKRVSDYNIFNSRGAAATAYVALKEFEGLPIKTYREIDGDTFGPIVNGFSGLNEIGEGAAIQLLFMSAKKQSKKSMENDLEHLKRGMPLSEMMGNPLIPKNLTPASILNPKAEDKTAPRVVDETAIKALEMKISKPLFYVNLRILASGPTQMQADTILEGLISGFSQFSAPFRNSFKVVKPRNMEKLIYQFSFRNFDDKQSMVLNSEEVASFFHLPISTTETPRVKWLKAKEAPPPPDLPSEGLLLGENEFRGIKKPIYITDADRRRHLYIVGQTGTGKSTLIYNMALEDIRNGKGIAIVDPHGELINSILGSMPLERADDVIIFDPGDVNRPIGLNMLEHDFSRPEQRTFIVNELYGIFDKLYDLKTTGGPMFEQYMKNALLLLMEDMPNEPATLVEVPRVFTDTEYRERKLDRIKNPVVIDFWRNEAVKAGGEAALANMTPYITSKFNNFIANDYVRPIIGQAKSAFNFREMMDSGKILLINLSKGRIGDVNANLLGMIITGRILMAALSRADLPNEQARRDFYLYIDEFQNFTTDSIGVILSEARKYRLDLIMAHQFIAQLTDKIRESVFGNVGSMIAFRVGTTDTETLVKQFEPVFNQNDLINIDNLNAYVKLLINGATSKPFNMRIPLNYKVDPVLTEKLKEINHFKFGAMRDKVEEEIYRRLRS